MCVDVNFWKSFVHERLPGAQAAPSRGRKRYTQADLALKQRSGR